MAVEPCWLSVKARAARDDLTGFLSMEDVNLGTENPVLKQQWSGDDCGLGIARHDSTLLNYDITINITINVMFTGIN